MRGSGIAAAVLLLAVAAAGMIADTADAGTVVVHLYFPNGNAWIHVSAGEPIPTEGREALLASGKWYTEDGTEWDLDAPVTENLTLYRDGPPAPEPEPQPEPEPEPIPEAPEKGPGIGAMACAGLIAAGLIGAAGWMFLRRK